jgi:hypothetical protein
MSISKMKTYLNDKMPPKKVKLKTNKWDLAKFVSGFLTL